MNKQEAIEKIEGSLMYEFTKHIGKAVNVYDVIDIVKQIDESQKVVVPKFVAEYIEYCKHEKFYALHGAYANMDDRLKCWRFKGNNIELFAKAWLYGYEIEKEKLYTVEIPEFRAWDKKCNEMFKDTFAITESGQVIIVEQESVFDNPDYVFTDDLIIMQSTGLIDENGKEIFEGDVLKTYDGELAKVVWNKELACWEAEFLGEIVCLSEVADVKCNRSYCEIVGNIWEDPELWEEEA